MKTRFLRGIGFLIILIACIACQPSSNGPTGASLANPASVYCEEQGGKLEFRTTYGGTQGICVFEDGSECDEWEFYRGDCAPGQSIQPGDSQASPAAPSSEEVTDWIGYIRSTPAGAQFDDYFERSDPTADASYGIESLDPDIQSQIVSLRDSGKLVHLWGMLYRDVPDYNGTQIVVTQIQVEE